MSSNSNNIEERLIPYIEGVLNEREQREVEEAIKADADLAREVAELKEVIGDLREAFASGVQPRAEELSVEEVVKMASHDGDIETMPGSSEQKARLFCNDQALEEYRLLRGLTEDMQQTTLPIAEVPPMPDSLLAEIARYKTTEKSAKVLEFAPRLTPKESMPTKGGFLGFIDQLNPKPLMAAAAALVLLTLGIQSYNKPTTQSPTMKGDKEVSYGYDGSSPAAPKKTPITETVAKKGNSVVEPTGVTVFTSGDRELLKDQAEKLLANKVRYTVTEDRILVSEKEVAQARSVLWGDDEAAKVAMAEEKSGREAFRPDYQKASKKAEDETSGAGRMKEIPASVEASEEEELTEFVPPPITHFDLRKDKKDKVAEKPATPSGDEAGGESADAAPARDIKEDLGQKSALRRKSGNSRNDDQDDWSQPSSQAPEAPAESDRADTGSSTTSPEAANLKGASREERQRILKAMALGKSEPGEAGPAPKQAKAAPRKSAAQRQEITRSRAPEPHITNRPAPVANVITSDQIQEEANLEAQRPSEDARGSVAVAAGVSKPQALPAESEPPPAPPVQQGTSTTNAAPGGSYNDGASEGGDVDLRMAIVRDSQAAVARRHNVVLSVESVGNSINVYVRPNKELSKSELDDLRRVLRAELGLSASDSIIFR